MTSNLIWKVNELINHLLLIRLKILMFQSVTHFSWNGFSNAWIEIHQMMLLKVFYRILRNLAAQNINAEHS